MASSKETIDFLLEQMAGAGTITARKMFGEYGMYCDGKIMALVCDDELFVKRPTPADIHRRGRGSSSLPWGKELFSHLR